MKSKLFRKHASVIPTGAPTLRSGQAARSGGIPSFGRFLATLGMTALFYWSATAQNSNGVTVSNLAVNAGTITFNVSWQQPMPVEPWSDSVWVFVDYNKNGVMTRLPVTSATATAGTVTKIQGNDKGVWVIGNARSAGNFSATVQLFTDITDVVGACAYASNYPPVGEYTSVTDIVFTGTPMYNIVLEHASGSTITRRSDSPFSVPASYTVQSFTDATGAPGIPPVKPDAPPFAATCQTWRFGSSTLTWSDRINAPTTECTLIQPTNTNGTQPEHLVSSCDGRPYYLYNYACLAIIGESLCPSPWHWASLNDYASIGTLTAEDLALDTWDTCPYFDRGSWSTGDENAFEWTSSPWSINAAFVIWEPSGSLNSYHNGNKCAMMAIRCAK